MSDWTDSEFTLAQCSCQVHAQHLRFFEKSILFESNYGMWLTRAIDSVRFRIWATTCFKHSVCHPLTTHDPSHWVTITYILLYQLQLELEAAAASLQMWFKFPNREEEGSAGVMYISLCIWIRCTEKKTTNLITNLTTGVNLLSGIYFVRKRTY